MADGAPIPAVTDILHRVILWGGRANDRDLPIRQIKTDPLGIWLSGNGGGEK